MSDVPGRLDVTLTTPVSHCQHGGLAAMKGPAGRPLIDPYSPGLSTPKASAVCCELDRSLVPRVMRSRSGCDLGPWLATCADGRRARPGPTGLANGCRPARTADDQHARRAVDLLAATVPRPQRAFEL